MEKEWVYVLGCWEMEIFDWMKKVCLSGRRNEGNRKYINGVIMEGLMKELGRWRFCCSGWFLRLLV